MGILWKHGDVSPARYPPTANENDDKKKKKKKRKKTPPKRKMTDVPTGFAEKPTKKQQLEEAVLTAPSPCPLKSQ